MVEPAPLAYPSAKIPIVLLPAAEPPYEATVAAPPALTKQPEYVYLSRAVLLPPLMFPIAKILNALFPAAEPRADAIVAAPPALTTQPE